MTLKNCEKKVVSVSASLFSHQEIRWSAKINAISNYEWLRELERKKSRSWHASANVCLSNSLKPVMDEEQEKEHWHSTEAGCHLAASGGTDDARRRAIPTETETGLIPQLPKNVKADLCYAHNRVTLLLTKS